MWRPSELPLTECRTPWQEPVNMLLMTEKSHLEKAYISVEVLRRSHQES